MPFVAVTMCLCFHLHPPTPKITNPPVLLKWCGGQAVVTVTLCADGRVRSRCREPEPDGRFVVLIGLEEAMLDQRCH